MSRARTILILLTALTVVGFAVPAQAAGPLRIMLEGDSITQGFHRDFTWRVPLDRELDRQGVAADLVGSRAAVRPSAGFSSAAYADAGFDTNHFAFSGSTLAQHVRWVSPEVASQDPDVLVLAAGINDLRRGSTPVEVESELRAWIAAARAAKPALRLVVSPVLDALDLGAEVRAYDLLAAATVAGA